MGSICSSNAKVLNEDVQLQRETKYFAQWKLKDVQDLYETYQKTWGFAITESQLESLMLLKQPEAVSTKEIFAALDANNDGRIDGLEFLGGLIIVCQGTFEEKSRFAFEVFDFNLNGSLSSIELALLMKSSYIGILILLGQDISLAPSIVEFMNMASHAFKVYDQDNSKNLNYEEFISWARSNRDFMLEMEKFRSISDQTTALLENTMDVIATISDEDSDLENECIIPENMETYQSNTTTSASSLVSPLPQQYAPSYQDSTMLPTSPSLNIHLEWVHGYRAHDVRNNIQYTVDGNIVYTVSKYAIIYNTIDHTQQYYLNHENEIISLAITINKDIIATGDISPSPQIHVWHAHTLETLSILQNFHHIGIYNLAFSAKDNVLLSIGLDKYHSIAVWDYMNKNIIASSVGDVNKVFGCAVHPNGSELTICGQQYVHFYRMQGRILCKENANFNNMGKLQGFLCVAYFNQYVIVGTSSGQLYQFLNKSLLRISQAHSVNESVNCLHIAMNSIISAGKDGTIRQYDTSLQSIGLPIDISHISPINVCHDFRISSLSYYIPESNKYSNNAYNSTNKFQNTGTSSSAAIKICIGTRSSEIYEIDAVQNHAICVTKLHSTGRITALATTNKKAQYVTCGDDKSIRLWSLRKRCQLKMKYLTQVGNSIAYANQGDLIAVGCKDGTIYILDDQVASIKTTCKHIEHSILCIRFSPQDKLLATATSDGMIFIYQVKVYPSNFRSIYLQKCSILKTSSVVYANIPIVTFDFSIDSKYIQSLHTNLLAKHADHATNSNTNSDFRDVVQHIQYWDLKTTSIVVDVTKIKNISWFTYTLFKQHFPKTNGGSSNDGGKTSNKALLPSNDIVLDAQKMINKPYICALTYSGMLMIFDMSTVQSCTASHHNATSMSDFEVQTSKPYLTKNAQAHSTGYARCGLARNNSTIMTIGLTDRCICQWKTMLECTDEQPVPVQNMPPNPTLDCHLYITPKPQLKSTKAAAALLTPSYYEPNPVHQSEPPDLDLELEWVHGMNFLNSKAHFGHTDQGELVYAAATLSIVFNKVSHRQRFHTDHKELILSIAMHPTGKYIATSSGGESPKIVIFNSETLETISTLFTPSGAVHLSFYPSQGHLLGAILSDPTASVAFYLWNEQQCIAKIPNTFQRVEACLFSVNSIAYGNANSLNQSNVHTFITCGANHVKFWFLKGNHVTSQSGVFGRQAKIQTVTCIASVETKCIDKQHTLTGTINGDIIVWENVHAAYSVSNAHAKAITSLMCSNKNKNIANTVFSCCLNGDIGIWQCLSNSTLTTLSISTFLTKLCLFSLTKASILSLSIFNTAVNIITSQGDCLEYTLPANFDTLACASTCNQNDPTQSQNLNANIENAMSKFSKSGIKVFSFHAGYGHNQIKCFACHPESNTVYTCASDDLNICVWDLKTHLLKQTITIPQRATCLEFSAGKFNNESFHLAITYITGTIQVLNAIAAFDTEVYRNENRSHPCTDIKYAPKNDLLALACLDGCIYIFTISGNISNSSSSTSIPGGTTLLPNKGNNSTAISQNIKYELKVKCVHAIHSLKSIDFNNDGSIVRSNCCNMIDSCCLFWNTSTGALLEHSIEAREASWATCTTVNNWSTQGFDCVPLCVDRVHGDSKALDVHSTDPATNAKDATKSADWRSLLPVLAIGDSQGAIHITWYPNVDKTCCKTYHSHSLDIGRLRFSYDNQYLISSGLQDYTLMVWKTDFLQEMEILRLSTHSHASTNDGSSKVVPLAGTKSSISHAVDDLNWKNSIKLQNVDNEGNNGDEALAVKPWLAAIREPSNWSPSPGDSGVPDCVLNMNFVYGYRGFDTRNNVKYCAYNESLIYHTAALGIIYNVSKNKQIYQLNHTDDILCLAIDSIGHLVATGEIGKRPKLIVWDSNSGTALITIVGFHTRGINHVAFNSKGDLVASHGLDDDHSLAIYNLQGKMIASARGSKQNIYSLSFVQNELVSVGAKTILFWNLNNNALSMKKGIFDKANNTISLLSIAYISQDIITGQSNGTLYRWKGRTCTQTYNAHKGAVNALYSDQDSSGSNLKSLKLFSGGQDGQIKVYDSSLIQLYCWDLNDNSSFFYNAALTSIYCAGNKLIFGTKGCEIGTIDNIYNNFSIQFDFNSTMSASGNSGTTTATSSSMRTGTMKKINVVKHTQGHYSGALYALDMHPLKQQFLTAGEDLTVRLWDAPNNTLIQSTQLKIKPQCAAFSPDGNHIAIGMQDGTVTILKETIVDMVSELKCSAKSISVVKYSPDGKTLAVGSHDQHIYLFYAPAYRKKCVCKGHSSYITHLDFSSDSQYIQSNCGAYELLFWNAEAGAQIPSANTLRDVKWYTWTCTLGWPVQGIWPPCSDGTDVNCTYRSHSQKYLITGDDFSTLKVFKYPSVIPKSKWKEYHGHSSHVMNCGFTKSDMYVISIGGNDNTIIQYKANTQ